MNIETHVHREGHETERMAAGKADLSALPIKRHILALLAEEPPRLVRAPLARGRKYQFAGDPSGITVSFVAFRGHPEDDGGLAGVSVSWWGGISRPSMFYPCSNDAEFWSWEVFSNASDCPND